MVGAVLLANHLFTPSVKAPAPAPSNETSPAAQKHAPIVAGPAPLLKNGQPVAWWFVFKFNTATLPGCGGGAQRSCLFGGTVQDYTRNGFGQQFAVASSEDQTLQAGGGCAGDTTMDPVGATFGEVYNGTLSNGPVFYVLWNDQFNGDPIPDRGAPAGHSKGVLAWDKDGNGLVMQVSTPAWPGSGSAQHPRQNDGNTLGCVINDDVLVSQQFFSLKLTEPDVVAVLAALNNSSVATNVLKPELVSNGGPQEIQDAVGSLGKHSKSKTPSKVALSSGVTLISKPSGLHVPPWQLVSSLLGSEPLRVASWWANPQIQSTTTTAVPGCWDASLAKPGAVDIATTGTWEEKSIGLKGTPSPNGNHAKIGVSTGTHPYVVFGDMNQQGSLSDNCESSQNGRGGLFFVLNSTGLFNSVSALLKGESAASQ